MEDSKIKNNKIYKIINMIVISITIILLVDNLCNNFDNIHIALKKTIIIIIIYITINILKCIKQYLIFIEERISLFDFLRLYIKTTFVNIILPFKLGEIFSVYCYGYKINNYKKGFLGIIINRFIDTIVLLFLIIPLEFVQNNGEVTQTTLILIAFVVVFSIFLIITPTSYQYLNKFFIKSKPSKVNIRKLRFLEEINSIQEESKKLLKGRIYLCILFSVLSWTLEYQLIKVLASNSFNYNTFSTYINAAFYTTTDSIFIQYLLLASSTIFVIAIITYLVKLIKGRIAKNEKNSIRI